MNRWLTHRLTLLLLVALIIARLCLSSARSQQKGTPSTGLPLLPIFSHEQNSPCFVGTFHNDGDRDVSEIRLYMDSTIVLDGKTYAHFPGAPGFIGMPGVTAHNSISVFFDLSDYVPRREYNKKLKRWQWKSSLSSGKHTLTIRYGDKTYGPVSFVWDSEDEGLNRYRIYAP